MLKWTFHLGTYGLEGRDELGSVPAYKLTSVLTDHSALAEVLQTKCAGGHAMSSSWVSMRALEPLSAHKTYARQ